MLISRFGWFLAFAALLILGCAQPEEPASDPTRPPPGDEGGPSEAGNATVPSDSLGGADLPATRQDTIMLEGMPEPVTLALYRAPDWFPLPFYTYHPQDVVAEPIVAGEIGQTIRFTANMGGTLNDDAFVDLYVLPEGMTEEDARVMTRENAEDRGTSRLLDQNRFSWSLEEYAFEESAFVGSLALGRHGDRYFQILIAYPPEYGDGFGPRAALILDEWRWTDSGAGLR